MAKVKLPKYKYSAYIKVGDGWNFLFWRATEYRAIEGLKQRFGEDYEKHPECYKIAKERRTKSDW